MVGKKSILLFAAFLFISMLVPSGAFSKQRTLALFNLRPTNIDAMGFDGDILYALVTELEAEASIVLLSRREIEDKLYQAGLVQSDDPDAIIHAGKAVGAEFVLYGQVTKNGPVIEAELKLMDIVAKRIVKTWHRNFAGSDAILQRIPAFSKELVKKIGDSALSASFSPGEMSGSVYDVTELKAMSKGKKVILTWKFDPSHPIVEFNIYRASHKDGPFQLHGSTKKNLYTDKKIKKGRTYYYKVGMILTSGSEAKGTLVAHVKNAGERVPHAPLGSGGSGYVRRASIKFLPSFLNKKEKFKIKQYFIYKKGTKDADWGKVASISSKKSIQDTALAFTYVDTHGLEDGQKYSYSITAIDSRDKESPFSDEIAITTVERPSLRMDKENLLRKSEIAWNPVSGATGFIVYRKTAETQWEKNKKLTGGDTISYIDTKGLEDGTKYFYYVTTYDKKAESGQSNEVSGVTKLTPPPPTKLSVQSNMLKSAKLSWTPVDDPDIGGYNIYRGKDPEKLKKIAKVKGYSASTYVDKGGLGFNVALEDGAKYFYTVISFNLFAAEGKPTFSVDAVTKPRPGPVTGIISKHKNRTLEVAWKKNPEKDITSYVIYKSRNGNYWSKVATVPAAENKFVDSDVKPEASYKFKIVAIDATNLKSDPVESEAVETPFFE